MIHLLCKHIRYIKITTKNKIEIKFWDKNKATRDDIKTF